MWQNLKHVSKFNKYKWKTPSGEIKFMDIGNAHKHHPDWIKIN